MREYIEPKTPFVIDGRNIPYPVSDSHDYLTGHDGLSQDDYEYNLEHRSDFVERINQILALKQSCFLLMHTTHTCQSLVDDLHRLKRRLIKELKDIHDYEFDEDWVERMVDEMAVDSMSLAEANEYMAARLGMMLYKNHQGIIRPDACGEPSLVIVGVWSEDHVCINFTKESEEYYATRVRKYNRNSLCSDKEASFRIPRIWVDETCDVSMEQKDSQPEEWEAKVYEAFCKCSRGETFVEAFKQGELYIAHNGYEVVCFDNMYNKLWHFVTGMLLTDIRVTDEDIFVAYDEFEYVLGFDGTVIEEL